MGLLEKALEFKKEMNSRGRETVMDRIKGPAETDFLSGNPDGIRAADPSPESSGDILVLGNGDLRIIEDESPGPEIEAESSADGIPGERSPHEASPSADREYLKDFPEAGIHDEMKDREDEFPLENAPSVIETDEADESMLEEFAIRDDSFSVHGGGGLIIEDEMLLPEAEDEPDYALEIVPGEEDKSRFHETDESLTSGVETQSPHRNTIHTIYEEPETGDEPTAGPDRHDDGITGLPEGDGMDFEKNLFEDYPLLYEVENEIIKASGREELYDTILFSIMGQIGSTSSSMLVEEKSGSDRWIIAMSRGVKIDTEGLYFSRSQGILSLLADAGRIIDIDDYRNDESYRDDYLTYLSVDARYIAPVIHDSKLIGAVLLGEKVSVEDYTEKEKSFISRICDSAASVLDGMLEKEKLNLEISELKKNLGELNKVDSLQDMIVREGSIEKLESLIRDEFERQGISCYAVFGGMREGNSFTPVITEREDFLSLRESSLNIEEKSLLVRHLSRSEAPVIIDNFRDADMLKNSFSAIQLSRMSLFRAYPFVLGERVTGFIFIFRVRENIDLRETDQKIRKISRFIFAYLHLIRDAELSHRRQIDDMELVYQRIENELDNAREIGIPVSLVLFSIKNFRRYYNAYGYDRSRMLLRDVEKIIADRLGDGDFSVRYGRNRFLVVLPGKDRKYAVPLASAVRNRIVDGAGEKDGQLLVTFLIAQFPDDGNDPFSLMDSLE